MKENKDKKKELYEKPDVTIIELAADQVLAIGCKASYGRRGPSPIFYGCIMVNRCFNDGS